MDITLEDYTNEYVYNAIFEFVNEPWLIPNTVSREIRYIMKYGDWYKFNGTTYDNRTVCDSNGRIWKNGTAVYDYVVYATPFTIARYTQYKAPTTSGTVTAESVYYGSGSDFTTEDKFYKSRVVAYDQYTINIGLKIMEFMGEVSDDIFNNIKKPDYEVFKPAPGLYPFYEKLPDWNYYRETCYRGVDIPGLDVVRVRNVIPACDDTALVGKAGHMPFVPFENFYDIDTEDVVFTFPQELVTDNEEHKITMVTTTRINIPTEMNIETSDKGDYINVMEPYRMYYSIARGLWGGFGHPNGCFGCLIFPVLERRNV